MNGISTFPKKWLFKFDGLNLLVDISRYRNTLGFNNSVSFSGNPFFGENSFTIKYGHQFKLTQETVTDPCILGHSLQLPTDLVTFTEEILNGKLHFLCSVRVKIGKNRSLKQPSITYKHIKD